MENDEVFNRVITILKHLYDGGKLKLKDGVTIGMGDDFTIGQVLYRKNGNEFEVIGVSSLTEFTVKDLCQIIINNDFGGFETVELNRGIGGIIA